jgi:hypothetical protein
VSANLHQTGTSITDGAESASSWRTKRGYFIRVLSDLPDSFSIPIPQDEWRRAVFIPGVEDDTCREYRYPPRIYLVTSNTLAIFTQPGSAERPFVIRFVDLAEVHSYKTRLDGALEITANDETRQFRYSPVQGGYVDSVLYCLRSLWLGPNTIKNDDDDQTSQGIELTPRYRYVLESELDAGEQVCGLCYQPPREHRLRRLLMRRSRWIATFCLVLTDRRLMLITYGSARDAFSVSIRYALRSRIEAAATEIAENVSGILHLTLSVDARKLWHFSIEPEGVSSLLALIEEIPSANTSDAEIPQIPAAHESSTTETP